MIAVLASIPLGLHKVREGYVGVYSIGGAVLSSTSDPGYHTMIPFITRFREVQISVQTDTVRNIPCGTSGGVLIDFAKVEVVNVLAKESVVEIVKNYTFNYDRLWIYNKVHHEINQLCSTHTLQEIYIDLFEKIDELLSERLQKELDKWAPGLEIIAIRVTKPKIPHQIAQHFTAMEAAVAELDAKSAEQKIVTEKAETTRRKAVIEAEKKLSVAKINGQRRIDEKKSEQEVADIENEIVLSRKRAKADAVFYAAQQEADANEQLLTREFLDLERVKGLSTNAKFFVGSKIPDSLFVGSPDGVTSTASRIGKK